MLANGTRAAIGTVAIAQAAPAPRRRQAPRGVPSIRPDVERLVVEEAERIGADPEDLLETPDVPALDDIDLEGRTVLDLSGGPGHVARAARARGAAIVDSVHIDDDLAGIARLLDLYHRTTRVFVHESLEGLDRTYDVVLMLGGRPRGRRGLDALTAGAVVVR